MTGMGSWQDILESDEAKAIRKSAGRAYNLRRTRQRRATKMASQDTKSILSSREFDELRYHHLRNSTGISEARGLIRTESQSTVCSPGN